MASKSLISIVDDDPPAREGIADLVRSMASRRSNGHSRQTVDSRLRVDLCLSAVAGRVGSNPE